MSQQGIRGEWRSYPRWFQYSVVFLLILGIFFRFYHLDYKVYWVDEAHTSMRMSGYTRTDVTEQLFTGEVITVEDLQKYQQLSPERGWDDTLTALQGNAEHTPLYFLMARLWVEIFGYSVAVMRSLPALISLLICPALLWLSWELFAAYAPGWITAALLAVTPLQVLYAQEARPYTLWILMTVLSSATLLWAMRKQTKGAWVAYGVTVAAGFYTQLLFTLVAIAQFIYATWVEFIQQKWRLTPSYRAYLLATVSGILAFSPWIFLFTTNIDQVQETTASLSEQTLTLSDLIDQWFSNLSQAFLDRELGGLNTLLVALSAYALYYLWRKTSLRTWLLVIAIVTLSFLPLALPDIFLGGQRSLRLRYLFPFYLGIQIALGYFFAQQAIWARTWLQKTWRMVLVFLIVSGIWACAISSQAQVWWSKSNPRSGYYPVVSSIINREDRPLVVSDGPAVDTIALSYHLDPDVHFQLTTNPRKLRVSRDFEDVFLLNPSKLMRRVLQNRKYELTLLYLDQSDSDENEYRLWRIEKRSN